MIERISIARPGATLYAEVTGAGPAVVFAHGLGGNHMSWWQQLTAVADGGFTAITYAHRGFHPSTADATPDPSDFGRDLLAILDHLQLPAATVVGQSMGGWAAIEAVLAAPQRIERMVLSATTGTFNPAALWPGMQAWSARAEAEATALMASGIHPACGARMAREQPALHRLYQQIDGQARGFDKMAFRAKLLAARVRLPAEAKAITCPVLLVAGDEDCAVPAPAVAALGTYLPNAEAHVLPATGHSPYFERPDVFNGLLLRFLRAPR